MTQQPLDFSGPARRDRAIARTHGANTVWVDRMIAAIATIEPGRVFTSDLLWSIADVRLCDLPRPTEPRAMGAVVKLASTMGLIVRGDGYEKSSRPECHARPCARWRRTTHQGPTP